MRAGFEKIHSRPDEANGWPLSVSLVSTVWPEKPLVFRLEKVDPGLMPGSVAKLSSMASPDRPKKVKSAAPAILAAECAMKISASVTSDNFKLTLP